MTIHTLKQAIKECTNDIIFTFNGKSSGITSTVNNYIPVFQAWYGNDIKEYDNIEDVMNDNFYNGKALADIVDEIEITIL